MARPELLLFFLARGRARELEDEDSLIPQPELDGLEAIELDLREDGRAEVLEVDREGDVREDGEERPARLVFLDRVLLLRFCCAMETSVTSRLQLAGREPPGLARIR